ncbi:MAG TPA: DUF1778 domain-containing protein [Alphaproteobacteria bacterium]|nr:DUF1778 domain-containing protein [Alphaproteobacteria bacterium]
MARADANRIRNDTINIRVKPQQRYVIDRAAQALGKSRSEFILDTACREAEAVLLDRRFFALDDAAYRRFTEALNRPLADNPRLRKLLRTAAPWDK